MITRLFLPVLLLLCAGCAPMKTAEPALKPSDLLRMDAGLARPTYEDAYKAEMDRLLEEAKANKAEFKRAGVEWAYVEWRPVSVLLLQTHNKALAVSGPRDPYLNELSLYLVTLHEKLEAGLLTEIELLYLFEQKRSEIISRLRGEDMAEKRLLIEYLRSLENQDVHCRSYALGGFVNTDCN